MSTELLSHMVNLEHAARINRASAATAVEGEAQDAERKQVRHVGRLARLLAFASTRQGAGAQRTTSSSAPVAAS